MPTNDILPFCGTDTGSNLLTEAEYTASADRTSGNKPGVASSKLVNKALRQAAFIASQLAQFVVNQTGQNVLDDGNTTTLLANMAAALNPSSPDQINNLAVAPTVSANALTVAIKTNSNANASASNPIFVGMRSVTLTSGLYLQRSITAALSMVVSSGSTLGQVSGQPSNIYVYLIDNAGVLEVAVSHTLYPENQLVTTTAEGGVGGATSATAIYSTAARTSVPVRLVGVLTNTQATAGTWATAPSQVQLFPAVTRRGPSVQTFASGSGTYIAPAGVLYLRIRAVGGGGGGSGSGSGGGTGGTGGNTTFGSSMISCNGGVGGTVTNPGGAGGTAALGTGPIGLAMHGGRGQAGGTCTSATSQAGGHGGVSPFGGGGTSQNGNAAGFAAETNSGSGGGGGGCSTSLTLGGTGGGAGGYVDAIINTPLASYAYAIGAAGAAGTAGAASAGGAGGSGYIIVEEYYQ